MSEQTLAQRRAAYALNNIKELEDTKCGKYLSYVKSLPATILMNDLGQAAATLLASAKFGKEDKRTDDHRAYETLYKHLSSWLCRDDPDAPYPDPKDEDLMDAITNHNQDEYRCAQAEALAYLEWLKKFAVAFLKDGS